MEWRGLEWQAWMREDRMGRDRLGRRGEEWLGEAGSGVTLEGRQGMFRSGELMNGWDRLGFGLLAGLAIHVPSALHIGGGH